MASLSSVCVFNVIKAASIQIEEDSISVGICIRKRVGSAPSVCSENTYTY